MEERLNYHYSEHRRLVEVKCETCQKIFWLFVYTKQQPTIDKCCECYAGKDYRETFITAKWLSRI